MLAGVAVLGLILAGVPLAALLGTGEGDGGEDDPPARDRAPDAPDEPDSDEPPEMADADSPAPGPQEGDTARAPIDYEFVLAPGDHTISDFVAGGDTLTFTSDTWEVRLTTLASGEDGSAVEIAWGEAMAVLRFPGHPSPPVADMFLKVTGDGADPVTVPLADVLEPLDPDTPDVLPDDVPAGPPLPPGDPEAPDVPPGPGPEGDPLSPTDPDAPEDPPQVQRTGATP